MRADHRRDAGQDLDAGRGRGRRAATRGLEVAVEVLALGEGLLRGEDGLGVAGGEVLAVLRRAGLHEQRLALRRARDVQRPADPELRARVVDLVHPVGVGEDAGVGVEDAARRPPSCPRACSATSRNSAARW